MITTKQRVCVQVEIADTIVLVIELVGTVAFALSGAVMAVQRRMDIFGVLVLGVCTAVGGGVIRDILLGITPPNTFRNPVYALVAALASSLIFFVGKSEPEIIISNRIQNLSLFNFFDAMGLGIFTVIGINTAIGAGYGDNAFLQMFVGVTTGVGGGILRDMLAGVTPLVMRKHIYASASFVGAALYACAYPFISHWLAMFLGAASVVLIRVLAARYCWNLPVAIPEEKAPRS